MHCACWLLVLVGRLSEPRACWFVKWTFRSRLMHALCLIGCCNSPRILHAAGTREPIMTASRPVVFRLQLHCASRSSNIRRTLDCIGKSHFAHLYVSYAKDRAGLELLALSCDCVTTALPCLFCTLSACLQLARSRSASQRQILAARTCQEISKGPDGIVTGYLSAR